MRIKPFSVRHAPRTPSLRRTAEQDPHQTYDELLTHLRETLIPKYQQKAQISCTLPIVSAVLDLVECLFLTKATRSTRNWRSSSICKFTYSCKHRFAVPNDSFVSKRVALLQDTFRLGFELTVFELP